MAFLDIAGEMKSGSCVCLGAFSPTQLLLLATVCFWGAALGSFFGARPVWLLAKIAGLTAKTAATGYNFAAARFGGHARLTNGEGDCKRRTGEEVWREHMASTAASNADDAE